MFADELKLIEYYLCNLYASTSTLLVDPVRLKQLHANLKWIGVFQAVRGFVIMNSIIVIYYQSLGLSMTEVMLTQSAFSITSVLFEIPSGYISDVWGRRRTLIIGASISTLAAALYCFAYSFWPIIIAECCYGVGLAFISGTDSAILFDTLLELGETERSLRSEGRQNSIANFSKSIAGIAGGLVAFISIGLPIKIQFFCIIFTIPIALQLVEPAKHRLHQSSASLKAMWTILKESMVENAVLRWMLLFSGTVGSAAIVMIWFVQPYLVSCGLPSFLIGFAWTISNLCEGFFSISTHKISKHIKDNHIHLLFLFAIVAGFTLCGSFQALWSMPFLLLFYFVRGVNPPIFTSAINQIVTSDRRATILSLRQLITRALFAASGPVAGILADKYSHSRAMLICAAAFAVTGAILFWFKPRVQTT